MGDCGGEKPALKDWTCVSDLPSPRSLCRVSVLLRAILNLAFLLPRDLVFDL